jgi:hypothetical protein
MLYLDANDLGDLDLDLDGADLGGVSSRVSWGLVLPAVVATSTPAEAEQQYDLAA